ncbi:unnamed protein product [Rhodiola kirilowii]
MNSSFVDLRLAKVCMWKLLTKFLHRGLMILHLQRVLHCALQLGNPQEFLEIIKVALRNQVRMWMAKMMVYMVNFVVILQSIKMSVRIPMQEP